MVDDVGTNTPEDSSPDFAEPARANDNHVGIVLLRQLYDPLSRLPVADDVTPGDLQGQCNGGHETQVDKLGYGQFVSEYNDHIYTL